jgi:hypothetical protein
VLQLGQVPGDRHLEIPIHEQHKLARSPARPPPPVPSRPLSSKQAAERERERGRGTARARARARGALPVVCRSR